MTESFSRIREPIVQDRTIDLTYTFYDNGVATSLAGKQHDAVVKSKKSGQVIKTWSSAGTSPAITISTTNFNIKDVAGIAYVGDFETDIKLTDGTDTITTLFIDFPCTKKVTP